MKNQKQLIIEHLRDKDTLTTKEAQALYRIDRLAARIHELKALGHVITMQLKRDRTGKSYASYSLA